MKHYTVIERLLARLLGRFPYLKNGIKYGYQAFNRRLCRSFEVCRLYPQLTMQEHSLTGDGSFWGYYDASPLQNGHIAWHSFTPSQHGKSPGGPVKIAVDGRVIGTSRTWNWQQGCMLSWLDRKADKLIYNDLDNGRYISRIIEIQTGQSRQLDFAVCRPSQDGMFALSLNFQRLARLDRSYGYFNPEGGTLKPADGQDGVFYTDLIHNRQHLIISLEQLAALEPKASMADAFHAVNHLQLSPDNQRFSFIHRWIGPHGQRFSRLLTASTSGTDIFVLTREDMVSHCDWKNPRQLIAWTRNNAKDGYYLFTDQTDRREPVGENVLCQDGHPRYMADKNWIMTDTYPDRSGMSSLLLFHAAQQRLMVLGRFYSPLYFHSELRCDLHPRPGENGHIITFDSAHTGIRKLYSIDLATITG